MFQIVVEQFGFISANVCLCCSINFVPSRLALAARVLAASFVLVCLPGIVFLFILWQKTPSVRLGTSGVHPRRRRDYSNYPAGCDIMRKYGPTQA